MKKIVTSILLLSSINVFATTSEASAPSFDVSKLACHCEKHKMIFELKDGESLTEMSKHCAINFDKKNSMVKFFDDHSEQTVKCSEQNGKLEINTCKPLKHTNKHEYTKSSMLSESDYNNKANIH